METAICARTILCGQDNDLNLFATLFRFFVTTSSCYKEACVGGGHRQYYPFTFPFYDSSIKACDVYQSLSVFR